MTLSLWGFFRNVVLFWALTIPTSLASLVLFIPPLALLLYPWLKLLGKFPPEILLLMFLFAAGGGVPISIAHTYVVSNFHPHAGVAIVRISILYALMMSSLGAIIFSLLFYVGLQTEVFNLVPCSVVYGWTVGYLRATGKTVDDLTIDLIPYARNVAFFLVIALSADIAMNLVRNVDLPVTYLMIVYTFSIPHFALVSAVHTRLRSNWRRGSRSEIIRRSIWFALGITLLDVVYATLFLAPLALLGSWVFSIIPSALIYGWIIGRRAARNAF